MPHAHMKDRTKFRAKKSMDKFYPISAVLRVEKNEKVKLDHQSNLNTGVCPVGMLYKTIHGVRTEIIGCSGHRQVVYVYGRRHTHPVSVQPA